MVVKLVSLINLAEGNGKHQQPNPIRKKGYGWTQLTVKEQLVIGKDMDVNKQERLFNITPRYKLK